jgi:hypothetical protein
MEPRPPEQDSLFRCRRIHQPRLYDSLTLGTASDSREAIGAGSNRKELEARDHDVESAERGWWIKGPKRRCNIMFRPMESPERFPEFHIGEFGCA